MPTSNCDSDCAAEREAALRAARLDECIALSALCMDLALAGARQRTGRDPLRTGEAFLAPSPRPRGPLGL